MYKRRDSVLNTNAQRVARSHAASVTQAAPVAADKWMDADEQRARKRAGFRMSNVLKENHGTIKNSTNVSETVQRSLTMKDGRKDTDASLLARRQSLQPMSDGELAALYSNTIKMSSENKINEKNSWNFDIIEKLGKLTLGGADRETNFQLAGCTLDAGVKIYGYRVDSTHSTFYKFLGDLNSVEPVADVEDQHCADAEQADADELDNEVNSDPDSKSSATQKSGTKPSKKKSASSTLEPSWASITVTKPELDCAVDPLFKMMSAAFDQGGARGMVLNHLRLGKNAQIMFDSHEIPFYLDSRGPAFQGITDSSSMADFHVDDYLLTEIHQAFQDDAMETTINPEFYTFLEARIQSLESLATGAESTIPLLESSTFSDAVELDSFEYDYENSGGTGGSVLGLAELQERSMLQGLQETFESDTEENVCPVDPPSPSAVSSSCSPGGVGRRVEQGADLYEAGVAFSAAPDVGFFDVSSMKGWAGPDHWQPVGTTKSRVKSQDASADPGGAKRPKERKTFSIDFSKAVDSHFGQATFKPVTNLMSLLLSEETRSKQQTQEQANRLPEDHQLKVQDLFKFYVKPSMSVRVDMSNGVTASIFSANERNLGQHADAFAHRAGAGDDEDDDDFLGGLPAFDDDSQGNEVEQDEVTGLYSMVAPQIQLVDAPREIEQVQIEYARTAKKVDVHKLKDIIWNRVSSDRKRENSSDAVMTTMQNVISTLPSEMPEDQCRDLSPSFVFICLLHLANEHGLIIQGRQDMSDLNLSL
ncbi:Condensin complex subunit 2 [Porphyridium purpureum]|uniref:Condensin complex subunit 2 n=1 Tax=Porphyridium purpureum TaxID=35688 RepID=A0A5J4YMT7_PORPP|nr:Condensin complex subunit 2 [Porphyridium purpureum]|eukprot:POR9489..scf222_8